MKRSRIYKPLRDLAKTMDVKTIGLQMGQMNVATQNYPLPLPALLIEIGDFRFTNLAQHHQKGDGTISCYLYVNLVNDMILGCERENETIELLDYADDVFQIFDGFSVPGLTPLVRTMEYRPQYGKRYILFRVDFTTTIDSNKEIEQKTVALPPLEIEAKNYKF